MKEDARQMAAFRITAAVDSRESQAKKTIDVK